MTARTGKIVLVHRYFAPDTPPYAHILEAIAGRLAGDGHDVTVLTCEPSYRPDHAVAAPRSEVRGGYRIIRWRVIPDRRSSVLKAVNMVVMCLRILMARKHFAGADVVMAATTPPVLLAACVSLVAGWHRAAFVYHKQDVYPEVLPPERRRSAAMRVLRRLDAATERRAAAVVVLSEDMASTVRTRHNVHLPLSIINNFDPWSAAPRECSAPRDAKNGLTIAFAGNLGRFQGLDRVVALVRELDPDDGIEFHFFGDGVRGPEIRKLAAALPFVTFHGYREPRDVALFLRERADLGIVSVAPGVIAAAYPSKTMSYLRHGCPLLLFVEPSELSRMVEETGVGLVVSDSQVQEGADALRKLAADPSAVRDSRDAARNLYEERFAAHRQLRRWSGLFQELVDR